ncbi:hypothetical protein CBS101457_005804 [Exobasidium rhododendri]|nr:hypothetical protein CBS101457_005804 [Exobasidium rhododendri]
MTSAQQRSGLLAPSSPSTPRDSTKVGVPALTPRRSLVSLRQSFNGGQSTSTPRRGAVTPTPVPALPTPTAANRYASSSKLPMVGSQKAKVLEIGDEVMMDGTLLIGVLRHLGPVAFKAGEYAGLELIGSSTGKGKNDGSVQGVQYFACEPGNGLFCPAHKVSPLSSDAPTEATARPLSSMSARSGRSSVAGGEYRPSSAASSNRSRSSTLSNVTRPPTSTPGRTPSRNSMSNRPGSSLASRSNETMLGKPRLLPRKSVAEGLADEEDRKRAKTSAEEAAKAEGRITAGSRAHRFLNMNAKDLEANEKKAAAANDLFGSSSGGKGSLAAAPSSPLKDSLLGAHRGQTGLSTPKSRVSVGTIGSQTPRAGKPRSSIFSKSINGSSSSMLPPSVPSSSTKGADDDHLGKSANAPQSRGAPAFPQTPSRLAKASPSQKAEHVGGEPLTLSTSQNKVKNLLEEMDLTPRREFKVPNQANGAQRDESPTREGLEEGNDAAEFGGFALTTSDVEAEETPQAKIPISLYEESTLEAARLKAQLSELTKALQMSHSHVERVKMQAQQEAEKDLEEERRVEREDETRRRKDLERKELEERERNVELAKEIKKLREETKRAESEREMKIRDMAAQLQESEKLVESLKGTLNSDDGANNEEETAGRLKAKDLELEQLKERISRVGEEREKEREQHLRELDDLKAAGEEAFDIFQKEQIHSNEMIQETENKMALLEARAQEAIIEVERQRDEALEGLKPTSVAEIDHQSMQEQLSLAQKRMILLEDQLAESSVVMQQEREASIKRKDRFAELESRLKADLTKTRAENKRISGSEVEAKARVNELMEALKEARAALENERAELEILRTEALVIGDHDPHLPSIMEREKTRFEGEIDRLNGLLEGARSGKKEASRKVEEQSKEIGTLHLLVQEVRSHLKLVEEGKQLAVSDDNNVVELKRQIERLSREIESWQHSSQPLSEQVINLMDSHRRELQAKDEEMSVLHSRLSNENTRRTSTTRHSLNVPLMNGGGQEAASPTLSGSGDGVGHAYNTSPSQQSSKRFSSTSSQSRRSRTSLGALIGTPEHLAKEMAGLRSIVNTLNQELTESKVSSMQQDRELKGEVERWKEETRKWQLTVESMKAVEGVATSEETLQARNVAIQNQLEVESRLHESQQQVRRYKDKLETSELKNREETEKLNQDIAELEALCEATVWRREEQEAKRQELERQVTKLERRLERAVQGGVGEKQEGKASFDSISTALSKEEIVCDECGEVGHRMGDDCPYSKDDMLF